MRRRDERDRVLGPTWLPSIKYWRVMVITPGAADPKERRTSRYYREEDEATEDAIAARQLIDRNTNLTMGEVITAYELHLTEKGTIGFAETVRRLRAFFPDLSVLLGRITPDRCKGFYATFRKRLRPDGEPISVDYHRATLINARSLFTWCIEQGWMDLNPLAAVKGIGRRNAGKPQLTGDEAARLYAFSLAKAEAGDRAALGVLMAFLMALRSSDLTRRVVRDVDLGGTVLRVTGGKTKKSNRPRRIPLVLRPLVAQLVEGRSPFEPLFPTPYTASGHHTRRWLEEAMGRFCKAAGVPYVCPHALKGMAGTVLAEEGEAGDVIAAHLSHEKKATSERHYVAVGVAEEAQAERLLKVISGGKA